MKQSRNLIELFDALIGRICRSITVAIYSILSVIIVLANFVSGGLSCVHRESTLRPSVQAKVHSASEVNEPDARFLTSLRAAYRAMASEQHPSLYVVDSPEINAASIGEERFFAYSGLSELPRDEMDAVFAHEMSHQQLLHPRRAAEAADASRFIGLVLAFLGGAESEGTSLIVGGVGNVTLPRYSRQQESEADRGALSVLRLEGYSDPGELLIKTFEDLQRRVGDQKPSILQDHPAWPERIQRIRDLQSMDSKH